MSNFLCKLVIDKQLISKAKQQNCYGSKIEKISELSKLLSVKTRMSDDLFHLFGKFGIGHLLSRLSLEKQDGVSASELILSLCWKRVLTCIERILRILEEVLGMTPQHLMATISGNDKEMSKILVMAEALEKWNEARGKTLVTIV